MNDLGRSATATKSSLVLLAFVLGAGLVLVLLDLLTSNRIQIADEAWLRQQLSAVLTEEQTRLSPSISLMHNSDDKNDNERPDPMYRVSSAAATIGFIMTVSAPDGYNGNIDLLLGVDPHGEITGVRVIQHRETPGLVLINCH